MSCRPCLSFVCLLVLCFLTACSGMKVADYEKERPEFRPEKYFLGETKAWGVFYDFHEKLSRHFTVQMKGHQEGDSFILEENFVFNDGERDFRRWEIKSTGEKTYEGTAEDVVGKAAGEVGGNAIHWRYRLLLKTKDGRTEVGFDDWMFLLDETHLFNRAKIRKFGLEVGEVILFFDKPSGELKLAADLAQTN